MTGRWWHVRAVVFDYVFADTAAEAALAFDHSLTSTGFDVSGREPPSATEAVMRDLFVRAAP